MSNHKNNYKILISFDVSYIHFMMQRETKIQGTAVVAGEFQGAEYIMYNHYQEYVLFGNNSYSIKA